MHRCFRRSPIVTSLSNAWVSPAPPPHIDFSSLPNPPRYSNSLSDAALLCCSLQHLSPPANPHLPSTPKSQHHDHPFASISAALSASSLAATLSLRIRAASVPSSVSDSVNHLCFRAALAVMRDLGS